MKKFSKVSFLVMTAVLFGLSAPVFAAEESIETEYTDFINPITGTSEMVYDLTGTDLEPFFTVKIPKKISLDVEGMGKYTVGVKGRIPNKRMIEVTPDTQITMKSVNGWSKDILADVTASKTIWTKDELGAGSSYIDSNNNKIQMKTTEADTFKGNLNFNISAKEIIEVGTTEELKKWVYTTDESAGTVTLTKYNVTDADVTIYGKYAVDNGKVYDTVIGADSGNYTLFPSLSSGPNNNVTSVTINYGVKAKGSLKRMFDTCSYLRTVDLLKLDTSEVTDMSFMFSDCHGITELNLSGFYVSNVTNMSNMFFNCGYLTKLDLTGWDTSYVTDMSNMFAVCSRLIEIKVSADTWVTASTATDMFRDCGVSDIIRV